MNPLDLLALTPMEAELFALCCTSENYGLALKQMGGIDAMRRACMGAAVPHVAYYETVADFQGFGP